MPPTARSAFQLSRCLLAAALVAAAACGGDSAGPLAAVRAAMSEPVDPFTTDAVLRGAQALERELGAPVQALAVEVMPHHVLFSVQDPKNPGNVDAWELRNGELLPPRPVQLTGGGDLAVNLFPLAAIPLDRLPELAKAAAAETGIAEGKVRSLTIRRRFSALAAMPGAAELQAAMERSRREVGLPAATPDPEQLPDGAVGVELYVDGPRRRGFVLASDRFEIVRVRLM